MSIKSSITSRKSAILCMIQVMFPIVAWRMHIYVHIWLALGFYYISHSSRKHMLHNIDINIGFLATKVIDTKAGPLITAAPTGHSRDGAIDFKRSCQLFLNGIIWSAEGCGKLDKSMACRHLKSPWSLSDRSLHLILVTKWSRSWSWMPPFCSMSFGPPIPEIRLFQNLTLTIQGQGHGLGQTQWSHLRPRVQPICILFISWQSEHFWLRNSKFHISPWQF